MSDTEKDVPPVETGDAEEAADVIRPVTAGTEAVEDAEGATEYADGSRPVTAGESNYAEGDEGAGDGDAADRPPSASERPASARPPSARPASAKPDAVRPPSARPDSARPPSAKPDAARPPSARPASARPPSAKPAPVDVSAAEDGQPSCQPDAAGDGAKSAEADAADASSAATPATGEGEGEGAGAGEREPDAPASNHGHHPDVITDINQSPEAHAEVDEIAQQQAREIIRSRQSSACSERKAGAGGGAEEDKRRSSASNGSVRSSPPSRQGPNETIANMAMQPPSPSKIKTGPWLTGTYRLPKSGKIISGEELCDALERMTNAYIDKYTKDKGGAVLTKEVVPVEATVFNTKKLTQDEYDSMIARLYKPKDRSQGDSDRIQLITLKFGEDGQEQWVPVKTVSAEEQKAYMCELYQRCLDNRKKTQLELAAKYLKPLGGPRKK